MHDALLLPIIIFCLTDPGGSSHLTAGFTAPHAWACVAGEQLHLMSPETYEQITVPEHLFGSAAAFLVPDMAVTVNSTEDGQHLSGELPPSGMSGILELVAQFALFNRTWE